MPLSWNEIRSRARDFSADWADAASENAEAQTFWNDFFEVFGVSRRRVATFERKVRKLDGGSGRIDLLWKGVLLVEHKSRGKDLTRAHQQAVEYFPGLAEHELPRYILVSDFSRFQLHDLDADGEAAVEFPLDQLADHIERFAFIAGYQTQRIKEQDPVNIAAAEAMGKLHDQLQANGYAGHDLEVLLVRLLFCLFAEDTGIFERMQFQGYIEERAAVDGSDLGMRLHALFQTLNTESSARQSNLDEQLGAFVYVNGKLFEEALRVPQFDSAMRKALLHCCDLDWSRISPAIFGAMFQSIMDKDARRALGAHYTSEANILKLINPLFMDDLRAEFEKARGNKNKLFQFHKKLHRLQFLDPACGCGNFLVIAYRELRLLELDVLRATRAHGQQALAVTELLNLNVDQFYGIEIEEFPAQIAQVALYLMDHQMNREVSKEFGLYFARIPLTASPNIVYGNALQLDWREVVSPHRLTYIMGNPPFIGKNYQTAEQKREMKTIFGDSKYAASLDYVTAWYKKALAYIPSNPTIKCAFVSTNSITQGESIPMLWPGLLDDGIQIHFAHRTFKWTNEARGKAAVHCVIIGFGLNPSQWKRLFFYDDIAGEPQESQAANINPYLIDAGDTIIPTRRRPLSNCPAIINGSKPTDGGHLLLNESERNQLIATEPEAARWIKPYSMGNEFINGISRFCLWLKHCPPNALRQMPLVMNRVAAVKAMREQSSKKTTREAAKTPTLFQEIRQPDANYLAIPRVSSERRNYIPIGYLASDHIAGDKLYTVPNATLYDFGIVTSLMHMAWVRVVCGRLKSDYSYSAAIVYNNFPWPKNPTENQKAAIQSAAQAVLDARAQFSDSTLADLYDPLTMPPALAKAHAALDKTVDRAYRRNPFNTEAERVAFLFDLYQQYTAPLLPAKKKRRRKKTAARNA